MKHLLGILFLFACLLTLSAGGAVAQDDMKIVPIPIRGVRTEGKMAFHKSRASTARDAESLCERELWMGVRYPAEASDGRITHLLPVFYDIVEQEFFIFDKANEVCYVHSFLEDCSLPNPKYVYGGLRVIPFADLTILAKSSDGSFVLKVLNKGRLTCSL